MSPEIREIHPKILSHVARNPELYRLKEQLLIRTDLQNLNRQQSFRQHQGDFDCTGNDRIVRF